MEEHTIKDDENINFNISNTNLLTSFQLKSIEVTEGNTQFYIDNIPFPRSSSLIRQESCFGFNSKTETNQIPGSTRAHGPGLHSGFCESSPASHSSNSFNIRHKGLDLRNLEFCIRGPKNPRMIFHQQKSDLDSVGLIYIVSKPCIIIMEIYYEGRQMPLSPFRIPIKGDKLVPTEKELAGITVSGPGTQYARIGEKTKLKVTAAAPNKSTDEFCLDVGMELYNGRAPCLTSVDKIKTSAGWILEYTCPIQGPFLLCIQYGGLHIAGSPFIVQCHGGDFVVPSKKYTATVTKGLFAFFKRFWRWATGFKEDRTLHQPSLIDI